MSATIAKVCNICGMDVSGRKRVRDDAGRYYCRPCYENAAASQPLQRPSSEPTSLSTTIKQQPNEAQSSSIWLNRRQRIVIGGAVGVSIIAGAIYFSVLRQNWGKDQRDRLMSLTDNINRLSAAGDLQGAKSKFTELTALLVGYQVSDPHLREAISEANADEAEVENKLHLQTAQREANAAKQKAQDSIMATARQAVADIPKHRLEVFQNDPVASFEDFANRFVNGVRRTERFKTVELAGTDVRQTSSETSPHFGFLELTTDDGLYNHIRLGFDGSKGQWTLSQVAHANPIDGSWEPLSGVFENAWAEGAKTADRWPWAGKEYESLWPQVK